MTCQQINYILVAALIGAIFFGPMITLAIRSYFK